VTAYDEPTQTEQIQDIEAIPVHIASSHIEATRSVSPEFGTCMTWNVDTFTNMGRPRRLLTRRYRREKAVILISLPANTIIVLNSKEEPLEQAAPIGFSIGGATATFYELDWENQQPLYAVVSAGVAVNISVLDQAFEET
jgi:hypothetical protein